MPQVPFTAFYLGPFAVYPTSTGLQDPITGAREKGGNFALGNYCDLSEADALVWNQTYSPAVPLASGRYRIVKFAPTSTAAFTGFGKPCGWALGTQVQQVVVSATGYGYTPGTYTVSSTTSGGTQKATAQVVVGASGGVISATLLNPGVGFTSVPTFGLTELGTPGNGASVLAQMTESANVVNTLDSTAVAESLVRGIQLTSITAAQITAGAYVIIQEEGIANVLVTTATGTAAGSFAAGVNGGNVTTTNAGTSPPIGFLGITLDLAAANTTVRTVLNLPTLQS